jgi:soluble lytic murein transglycosylase-like protein
MQVLPSTWTYVERLLIGRKIPRTASGNIRVGVAFIRQLLHEFNGDPRAAIAAWYQGPTSLRKRGPYRATRLFVADVVALRERFI